MPPSNETPKRRIYLATSWKNPDYEWVLARLRREGFNVYDFKHPSPGVAGFAWDQIDADWKNWAPEEYLRALFSRGPVDWAYQADKAGLDWADTCVLLLPSGRSAHLEAGYCVGRGKETFILMGDDEGQADLMNLLADGIFTYVGNLVDRLHEKIRPGNSSIPRPNLVVAPISDATTPSDAAEAFATRHKP